ncbi:MAG: hypothetical protein WAL98_17930 [Desulfatiglandaceae bacterium]
MIKHKGIIMAVLATAFLTIMAVQLNAEETEIVRPKVNQVFAAPKEAKIAALGALSLPDSFKQLKDGNFTRDKAFLHKGIFSAFNQRKSSAVEYSTNILRRPVTETIDGKLINRGKDFYVAKKVMEVFPEESIPKLLASYEDGDSITKCNVIRASGNVEGAPIKALLIGALNDKTSCEDRHAEMIGDSLRICDMAYNQLVLRYKIKNVLRTIGTVHKVDIRDYHINILKDLF